LLKLDPARKLSIKTRKLGKRERVINRTQSKPPTGPDREFNRAFGTLRIDEIVTIQHDYTRADQSVSLFLEFSD